MDHALVCACGRGRTQRHNAVRDTICSLARKGGLQAQLEKGGLLPARHPSEEGRGGGAQDRRPADVWLPSGAGPENRPLAIDVATTSGMRQDRWTVTLGESAGGFLGDDETWKTTWEDTETQLKNQGAAFAPFAVCCHSGRLGPGARQVAAWLAQAAASKGGEDVEETASEVARCINISLMRESARAVLRRLTMSAEGRPPADPAGWRDDEAW